MAKTKITLKCELTAWDRCKGAYRRFFAKDLGLEKDPDFNIKVSETLETANPNEWDDDSTKENFEAMMRMSQMIFAVNAQKLVDKHQKKSGKGQSVKELAGKGEKLQQKVTALKIALKDFPDKKRVVQAQLKSSEGHKTKAQKALETTLANHTKADSDKKKAQAFQKKVQALAKKLGDGKENAKTAKNVIEKERLEKKIARELQDATNELALHSDRSKEFEETLKKLDDQEKKCKVELEKSEKELTKHKEANKSAGSGNAKEENKALIAELRGLLITIKKGQAEAIKTIKKECAKEPDESWKGSKSAKDLLDNMQKFNAFIHLKFKAMNDQMNQLARKGEEEISKRALGDLKKAQGVLINNLNDYCEDLDNLPNLVKSLDKDGKASEEVKKFKADMKQMQVSVNTFKSNATKLKNSVNKTVEGFEESSEPSTLKGMRDDAKSLKATGVSLSTKAKTLGGKLKSLGI